MTSPTLARMPYEPEEVVGLEWDKFILALQKGSRTPRVSAWNPGDHIALEGPTGEGKTTVAVHLLRLRTWDLALDPKGEDETLSKSGFTRITSLPPPRKIQQAVAEGKPARLIVGGGARSESEDAALERLMKEALDYARHSGGWTIYADEFQLLGDNRMYGLGPRIERMLITARRDRSSVITSFQAMAWVPKAAVRQATCGVALFQTRDRDMIQATARSMGRNWQDIVWIMHRISKHPRADYFFLWIPRSVREPMIITCADPV